MNMPNAGLMVKLWMPLRQRFLCLIMGFSMVMVFLKGYVFIIKKPFRLSLHIKRLQQSAAALPLTIPLLIENLQQAVHDTITASSLSQGYLRILITRGEGALGIDPATCKQPSVIIIVNELHMISDEQRSTGVRAIIAATRRQMPDQLDPRIKSINYLNSILARMEANYAGVEEAILLNDRGYVTEGTADNIFIVSDGELRTPPATERALAGITRATVMELAIHANLPVKETVLTAYDLYTADECFLTGTGAKLIPVREIDGRKIATCPGETYHVLSDAFTTLINKECV